MSCKNAGNHYSQFTNRAGEFFPCHKTDDPDNFNCLFCYCPLYALGDDCGGNFVYTPKGVKDCSNCLLPHLKTGYDYVTGNFYKIAALIQATRNKQGEENH